MKNTAVKLAVLVIACLALSLAGCSRKKNQLAGEALPPADDLTAVERANPLLPKNADKSLAALAPDDGGIAIEAISALDVEATVDGAIVYVEGIAARQGAYDARLIPLNEDNQPVNGVLDYTLRVYYPRADTPVGPENTRKVIVAKSLSHQDLEAVRVIRVAGAQNAREARRR